MTQTATNLILRKQQGTVERRSQLPDSIQALSGGGSTPSYKKEKHKRSAGQTQKSLKVQQYVLWVVFNGEVKCKQW